MKSIFQMGLVPNNTSFWLGQAVGSTLNVDALVAQLNAADARMNAVYNFTAQPNYNQLLGVDADRFNGMNNQLGDLGTSITDVEQKLRSNFLDTITTGQIQDINDYVNVSNALYAIVQAHSGPAAASTTQVSAPTPPPVNLTQVAAAPPPGVVPPVAPGAKPAAKTTVTVASPGPSPLLIGGLAAGALVAIALVVKH